jgi:hypothetical protein
VAGAGASLSFPSVARRARCAIDSAQEATMRHRLLLAVLCVAFVTLAFSSGGAGAGIESSGSHDPDPADPGRLAAAPTISAELAAYGHVADFYAFLAAEQAARDAEAARLAAEAAAQAEAEAARAAAASVRVVVVRAAPSGDVFACLRWRESHGDYGALSPNGTYRGAYQFRQSTWDSTAAYSGREDLLGVDPSAASPADQDAMAAALYGWQGSAPWGGAC